METRLIGLEQEIIVGPDRPTILIGERINPTGRKRLTQALKEGDLGLLEREARAQAMEGADIIDVNMAGEGIDEEALLPRAVQIVEEATRLPVSIDSVDAKSLEAALQVCRGKPLVNSVNGDGRSLARVLPLVKEHGEAVIGLAMDEEGIPKTPERRLEVADKILTQAVIQGISQEDVLIDPLALGAGIDQRAGLVVLETIRMIARELGVNVTLGASGVSFGLPYRESVNEIFLALAIGAGVTCPIANPKTARRVILVTDLLLGRDEFALRYIAYCRQVG